VSAVVRLTTTARVTTRAISDYHDGILYYIILYYSSHMHGLGS
jgi:hypothetical protein